MLNSDQRMYRLVVEAKTYEDFLALIEDATTPDFIAVYDDVYGQQVFHAVDGPFAGGIVEFKYTHLHTAKFDRETMTTALRERVVKLERTGCGKIPIINGQVIVS